MQIVHEPLSATDSTLPAVGIFVDRRRLAKRLWRAAAEDGAEFGFELLSPLVDGDCVFVSAAARYVICQEPEPVLVIPLPGAPDAAAITGWAVGNLHFPIEAQPTRLLAPDDIALRQSLERMGIAYSPSEEVFRPHRLAAGAQPHGHVGAAEHPFVFKSIDA